MIFILTPSFQDFKNICIRESLFYPDENVKWIIDELSLYGLSITRDDVILRGDMFDKFTSKKIFMLLNEIELRKK